MTPKDLFTVVVKSCGFISIYWALQALISMMIITGPGFRPPSSATDITARILFGVAIIFWAPVIASVCCSENKEE
ncbi:MAG: hypothetical protein JKY61_07425 [Planctomycetes bacterium]|nr:hypothetical protein [Planctomycetota bacterium]